MVAHAIATNRTLALLGMQILDGRDASYEGGTLSVRSAWLEAIIQSTGSFAGLVSALRQSYAEVVIHDGHGNILYEARSYSPGCC